MKYVETGSTDPRFNLAVEEFLFDRIADINDTIFMLWQNEPTIVVGRFQNTLEEINTDFVTKNSINVVRRMSGGGTVYHDWGNLNYTFIVNRESEKDFDFRTYCRPIVQILREKKVNADFSSRNDLTIDGKKFSGNAQYMKGGRLLHHGTLLFDSDLSVLTKALNVSPDKYVSKGLKSVRSRVTNIKPYLAENMDIDEFKRHIIEAIEFREKGLGNVKLDNSDMAEIRKLTEEKYSSWEWNYGSSPDFTEKKEQRFDFGKVEALLNVNMGTICSCKFYGDFFGNGELENLERSLEGVKYNKDSISKALKAKHIGHYFNGASSEDIIDFLSP